MKKDASPFVLLTQELPFQAASRFPSDWRVVAASRPDAPDPQNLEKLLPEADALVCLLSDTIDRTLLTRASDLRIVANIGVGYNNIDWEFARERGVVVTNTPGALTEATADLTMALILAAARRLPESEKFLRDGHFHGWDLELFLGMELRGATLGLVGMGRIGAAVARRARGFGMRILYHNRGHLPQSEEADLGAARVELEELLSSSDVISLHCPLTTGTQHLIGPDQFRLMKQGAILVNTSRGPVVDEAALVEALRSGKLMAAGLDVFEREPEIHPGLLELSNVILLPHIGSATVATRRAITFMAVDNVIQYLSTGRALNPVF